MDGGECGFGWCFKPGGRIACWYCTGMTQQKEAGGRAGHYTQCFSAERGTSTQGERMVMDRSVQSPFPDTEGKAEK